MFFLRSDNSPVFFAYCPVSSIIIDRILGSQFFIDVYAKAGIFIHDDITVLFCAASGKEFPEIVGENTSSFLQAKIPGSKIHVSLG